jgi:hypothetical protein
MPLRLLYIDINASYINPTRYLLPLALQGAGETTFFGPGYVSEETLRGGLNRFIDAQGPFDLAITNALGIFSDIWLNGEALAPRHLDNAYDMAFPPAQLGLLPAITREFERLSIPRVALMLESDYYHWEDARIEKVDRRTDYAIGFGPDFWKSKAEMPGIEKERFAPLVTDNWVNFIRTNRHRIASSIHFVGDSEFAWQKMGARPNAWSLVGVQYVARKEAREKLKAAGIPVVGEGYWRRMLAVLKRIQVRREPRFVQRFVNLTFQSRLESCRYSYTCGSALDMPVRKFFEVPAARSVLVCKPFTGFEAAGFRDGESAVVCAPEDIVDAHRMLEADQDRAQAIADAGQKLVRERHSVSARAAQFADTFAAMADRSFAGAGWKDGNYAVMRK